MWCQWAGQEGRGCSVWAVGLGGVLVLRTHVQGRGRMGIGRVEGVSDKWPMFGVCMCMCVRPCVVG